MSERTESVDVATVMAWEPCAPYSRSRVEELFAGRERMTGEQILDLDIPAEDRLWAVLHAPLLSERDIRLFAADIAEHVLPLYVREHPQDGRPRAAIEAARRFARGEIDDAAGAAAMDAASAAAEDAAWAAASAAARDAEREWQIALCREYLRAREVAR